MAFSHPLLLHQNYKNHPGRVAAFSLRRSRKNPNRLGNPFQADRKNVRRSHNDACNSYISQPEQHQRISFRGCLLQAHNMGRSRPCVHKDETTRLPVLS